MINILTNKYEHRDDGIAVAKAIGIISVVIGHCCAIPLYGGHSTLQTYTWKFIYMFHMPLFFFLSGYFLNWKYLDDKVVFIKKKIKGLWLPYVKWAALFIILHNVLLKIGMYEPFNGVVPEYYNLIDIIKRLLKTLYMGSGDILIGGFWFIPMLFFSSIFCLYGLYMVRSLINLGGAKKEIIVSVITLLLMLIISMLLLLFDISIPQIGITASTFLASAFFIAGFILHKINFKVCNKLLLVLILIGLNCCAIKVHFVFFGELSNWYDVPYIFIVGVLGTIACIIVSRLIAKVDSMWVKNSLFYIGENTLVILALHLSAFKIINLIKVNYYNLNTPYGAYPIILDDPSDNNTVWWMLYILVGVLLPVALKYSYDTIIRVAFQKNNKEYGN